MASQGFDALWNTNFSSNSEVLKSTKKATESKIILSSNYKIQNQHYKTKCNPGVASILIHFNFVSQPDLVSHNSDYGLVILLF